MLFRSAKPARPAGGMATPILTPNASDLDSARKALTTASDEYAKAVQYPDRNMSDRIARLDKESAALEGRRQDNLNMALVQAGLAMMGSTSPYAMQAIGAGGIAGLRAYAEGKKDIRDLEKDINARRDRIDDLVQAGKEGKARFEDRKSTRLNSSH